jgi:ribosomal protein S18 acetylase RimI-like enzyme
MSNGVSLRLVIQESVIDDVGEVLHLQRAAYESEAKLYNNWSLPALTQTIESLREEYSSSLVLKGIVDGKIIGSVRAAVEGDSCKISRLIVHPDYQRQGVGSRLLNFIEKKHDHVRRYELFTGSLSVGNIKLYIRHGYNVIGTELVSKSLSITYLEKYL